MNIKNMQISGLRFSAFLLSIIIVGSALLGCSKKHESSQPSENIKSTTETTALATNQSLSDETKGTDQDMTNNTEQNTETNANSTNFGGQNSTGRGETDNNSTRPHTTTTITVRHDVSTTTNPSSSESTKPSNKPTEPTEKPPFDQDIRRVCGSFIQPWYVVDWTQERWDLECRNMAEAGMKYIILQSIVDFSYNTETKKGQNPDLYTIKSSFSLYPSDIAILRGKNNGKDAVEMCLKACKKYNMQAMIGPVSDNRWWLYGWGLPQTPSRNADPATDSYMAKWTRENAEISNQIASEIMQKYGREYNDQIFGWYYNNEIWNLDAACEGYDRGIYSKILSNSMNLSLRHYSSITPGKPMMLSSFINPSLSSAQQCGKMWESIIERTEFRKGDIFAPQDSYGNNPNQDLDAWTSAYKRAVDTKPGLLFWSNNENFRANYAIALVDDFVNQINITAKYASANICFSWNHYYSPEAQNEGYNETYLQYIKTGKLDSSAPSKPTVNIQRKKIILNAEDDIGICGYLVYKGTTSNLFKTIVCKNQEENPFWLDDAGTYYVKAYDFCGNESAAVAFSVQ